MSEVYTGLRQRRKRTHPSKCPCCKNDGESEPENDEAAGAENHKEGSEVRQSRRRRQTKEEENINSDGELSDHSEVKQPAKKRKLRNTSTEKEATSKKETKSTVTKNKGKTSSQNKATKAPNKNKNRNNKTKTSSNTNKNSKVSQHLSDEDVDSEDEKEVSSVSKINTGNNRTRKVNKAKTDKIKSDNSKSGNKEIYDEVAKTSQSNSRKSKVVKRSKVARRTPMQKPSLALTKQKGNTSASTQTMQLKITVFDNLFHKLKTKRKDISVEQAAKLLMTISSESLQNALRSSEFHDGASRHEKKGISDTEEIVSQAAEALVSFRSKSPISRDEGWVEKAPIQAPSTITAAVISTQSDQLKTSSVTSATASNMLQSQPQFTSSLPPQTLTTTPVMASKASNILPAMLPTVSVTQSFPQLLPQNLTTTFTNLMPMVTSHGTLPSFNQIAAQLRPGNSLPGTQPMPGITPPILNTGLPNPALPTSLVLPQQPLIQPQLKQPFPLTLPNQTSKPMSSSLATTNPTPTTAESTINKTTSAKQNPLQQPLKGMEEVVGNVGSSVPPKIVWNINSPVVFLGSPQNLGGVPRNLVASPSKSQSNTSLDQGGYPPVAPRPVAKSDGLKSHAPVSTVPNVLTLGGRPILPRTQMTDDNTRLPTQQTGLPLLPQFSALNRSTLYPTTTSLQTPTQVISVNPKKPAPLTTPMTSFLHQNLPETSSNETLSPSSVSAKQAVKKLVHERTKSAELKKEGSGVATSHQPTKLKPILPLPPKEPMTVPGTSTESTSKNSEFNIEQAATALLSIGVPDGIEAIGLKQSSSNSKDDHEEDVVFTSKGTFRVGDVDVDPRYNRIGREGYTCGKCNKIFTSLSYLARHIKRVCPDMTCRKWKCSLCDKAFRHPFGLQQHVYTHTGERPHKCPLCPKAFYSSNDLRRHSRIHSGERPYRCKHCDKSFATTISLKTHTYIHTGEKPHKCPQCPKTFATSSKLGRHIVTHSEQRPFSCDQCPKSFNRSGDLRRHNLAVHDGKEKSFDCDLCPSTFTKSADLRRHTTTVHQKIVKTLECEDCGTQFSTALCLKMHKDTYHKKTLSLDSTDKIHTCDICGKTYSNATLLTKHKQTAHEPSSSAGYNPTQFQHIAPKPSEQTTVEPETG